MLLLLLCWCHNCAQLLGSCEVSGLPQASALEGDSILLLLGFGQFNWRLASSPYRSNSQLTLCQSLLSPFLMAVLRTMSVVWLSAIFHQILPYCQFCDEVNSGKECLSQVALWEMGACRMWAAAAMWNVQFMSYRPPRLYSLELSLIHRIRKTQIHFTFSYISNGHIQTHKNTFIP